MPAPIDLVVFDLGGVLVRIVRSWAEAHEAAGLPPHPVAVSPDFFAATRGLAAAHQTGGVDVDAWARGVADASGGVYAPGDALRVLDAWMSTEYPAAGAVIDAVEAAGVATGALSNTNSRHWAVLRPPAGEPRFPAVARLRHVCASHLLQALKPDPAVYAAYERCQGVQGARILFFDDLKPNVEAARRHGWEAHLVDHAGDTAAQMLGVLARYGIRPAPGTGAAARPSTGSGRAGNTSTRG